MKQEEQELKFFPSRIPVGAILAWAGTPALLQTATKDWLICDGSKIPRNRFPELCEVLSDNWGLITGNKQEEYTLPDLRGMFLRGVNQERDDKYSDPDSEKRVRYDNTKYNGIGSLQTDEFRSHNHPPLNSDHFGVSGPGGLMRNGDWSMAAKTTGLRGGTETRPKNAYVFYIIKAK